MESNFIRKLLHVISIFTYRTSVGISLSSKVGGFITDHVSSIHQCINVYVARLAV